MRYVILGTAGHIDHGKSSLVKALTGIDPDRLKEEKERGITIDLGFADLVYPDGLTVGIIDVPGHERLIKNMLAGAGGIDLVLFVIAADEGIMPQSREHLAICRLLKIKSGLIAITKADLVEKDWLNLVTEEVRNFVKGTFLEDAEIVPVSSKTGDNLNLLREKIKEAALLVKPKPLKEIFRLPIDRVFTLKGFGTVVTGTLISGSISVDETVEILPSGITGKVRGLHSHGKAIQTAYAGQRAAINLQAVNKEDLNRGDVAVTPKALIPVWTIDARIELLKDSPVLKSKSLTHFHLATSEVIARVILYDQEELSPGESCYCQLRLQTPVVALSGDRFIIRKISPVITIGGGAVLDPSPQRRRRKEGVKDLEIFESGALPEKLAIKVKKAGITGSDALFPAGWIRAELPEINEAMQYLKKHKVLIQLGSRLFHKDTCELISANIKESLLAFHKKNPLSPGLPKEELRIHTGLSSEAWDSLLISLDNISIDKDLVRLKDVAPASSDADANSKKLIELLEKAGFQPLAREELSEALSMPLKAVTDMLKLMTKEGRLVRINDSIYIPATLYNKLMGLLKVFFAGKPAMTLAEFRDLLGTTRKYALPFLEYLDSNRITLRIGDVRKLLLK